jgi:phage baseplate assembly protein W
MSTLIADITAADWSIKIGESGQIVENIDDISQCIRIIVGTPKGSRPHEPLFGCDVWKYLDRPFSDALPGIVAEVTSSLTEWEGRIRLISVTAIQGDAAAGEITIQAEWTMKGHAADIYTTEVII